MAVNKAGRQGKDITVIVSSSGGGNSERDNLNDGISISNVKPTQPGDYLTGNNHSSNTSVNRNCVEYEDISFGPNPEAQTSTFPQPLPEETSETDGRRSQPPYLASLSPQCVQSLMGYRVVLNCSAGGTPRPDITWEKDGKQLTLSHSNVRKIEFGQIES